MSEPDWGTFIVYDGEVDIGMKIAERWKASFANPYIGRELGFLLSKVGVEEAECCTHALTLRDFESANIIFDLRQVLDHCVQTGVLSSDEGEKWFDSSRTSSQNNNFFSCLNIIEYQRVHWEIGCPIRHPPMNGGG